jgi:hypothetical protein
MKAPPSAWFPETTGYRLAEPVAVSLSSSRPPHLLFSTFFRLVCVTGYPHILGRLLKSGTRCCVRAGKLRRKKGVVKRFFLAFRFNYLRGVFSEQLEPQKFAGNASVLSALTARKPARPIVVHHLTFGCNKGFQDA